MEIFGNSGFVPQREIFPLWRVPLMEVSLYLVNLRRDWDFMKSWSWPSEAFSKVTIVKRVRNEDFSFLLKMDFAGFFLQIVRSKIKTILHAHDQP